MSISPTRRKSSSSLDSWNVTPSRGIEIQNELRSLVKRRWGGRALKLIGGTDVHFPSKGAVRAAIAIFTYPELRLVESSIHEGRCTFPYVPGLLSFREIPPILEAWKKLKDRPDLMLCDGQGIAHPRGLGLASHLGLVLDIPTIGCAKSPLFGAFSEPGPRRGDRTPIRDASGKIIGTVVRTRDFTKPLYVSIGHLISLRKAVAIVLACTPRFRNPEPARAAHRIASSTGSQPG
jgi:deoxyribonuclease V